MTAQKKMPPEQNKMPPDYFSSLPPCERLKLVDEALFRLAAGHQKAQVRHGDYWVTYHPGSVNALKEMATRLRDECYGARALIIRRAR